MSSISSEQPPEGTPDELKEYLSRMLININIALAQSKKFPAIRVVPAKPEDGDIEYFSRVVGVITSVGFWGYEDGVWVKL